jgi:RNA polymerase sigma-70 factor (ECF subfamily)
MTAADEATGARWIEDVVGRFEAPLVRYATRILGNGDAARDVVQETFLRLCREDRGQINGHEAQWLFTVCRRRALDVLRKERRMQAMDESATTACLDRHESDTSAVERRDSTDRVLALVQTLSGNQQEVIRLKFQHELSYREISEVTGLTVSNIGYLLHTAIQTLRAALPHD